MSFQPSINIMYDIGKVQLFENYVPNVNQLDIMNKMLADAVDSQQHAHLLVGPYGAGKSLVGAITTSLISEPKLKRKEIKSFFESIYTVSPELEQNIRESLVKNKLKWIPVTITGKSGSFESIILESIQKKFESLDMPIILKNDATHMLQLIQRWDEEYPEVVKSFEKVLEQKSLAKEDFILHLKSNAEQAIYLFKEIYPEIAFGTPYHNPIKISFIEQLEYILDELQKKKIGIFLVFDEFGRFLQTVGNSKVYETMQQIQDFAELSNRRSNAFLLMITHTGLQQYVNEGTELTKGELERVEKRFAEHRLESDSTIFYRSAHKLLKKSPEQSASMFLSLDYEALNYAILKYNLFPHMTAEEVTGFILDGCQPIHPLTIQLLPSMSNLLGQNDRTLYLFLNQFNAALYTEKWYYVDQLFDYFYPEESAILTLDSMKYYRLATSYKVSEEAMRIVKLGTLLNLLNNRFPLTNEFIQFALGLDEAASTAAIHELRGVKLLRLNPFVGAYELYEGSLVIFEDLYKDIAQKTILSDAMRIDAIGEIFGEKYYLPLGYNTAKSMTRYIETTFAFANQPIVIDSEQDGTLLYILVNNESERGQVEGELSTYTKRDALFGIATLNLPKLRELVDQHLLLNKLLQTPELLQQDANLKKEILIRLESAAYHIQQLLLPLKQFNPEYTAYYLAGKPMKIDSLHRFEHCIDGWMFERFPYTPEIRNESFIKRKVMPIQRKSAISLLNQILQPAFEGEFDVTGNGPDYLIYATTFKNQQFNFKNLNAQASPELFELRKALLEHLETATRNSILSLFSIAMQEPFGLREAAVPLIVPALIKDKWNQMAFYSHDFSITSMTAEILYEIIEQQVAFYEYEIYTLEDDIQELLQDVNNVFFEDKNAIHPNFLFQKLTQWLLKLPRFTQITDKQSAGLLSFKEIVRASESDPLAASKKLRNLSEQVASLANFKDELESFCLAFKEQLVQETMAVFEVSTVNEIREKHLEVIQKSPQLQELVTILEDTADVDRFIQKVVGIKLEDWSDVTYDSYFATLNQLLTVADSEEIRLVDGDQVITTIKEMELSVKGNTIYGQLQRIVQAGGRTMNSEEVKYILYNILKSVE